MVRHDLENRRDQLPEDAAQARGGGTVIEGDFGNLLEYFRPDAQLPLRSSVPTEPPTSRNSVSSVALSGGGSLAPISSLLTYLNVAFSAPCKGNPEISTAAPLHQTPLHSILTNRLACL